MPKDIRDLIRKISLANLLWGAPRVHGELLKLGINVSQPTVAKYMVQHRKPPDAGKVVALPHLGGLHHEYVRLAA